jgi:hypothetical protein
LAIGAPTHIRIMCEYGIRHDVTGHRQPAACADRTGICQMGIAVFQGGCDCIFHAKPNGIDFGDGLQMRAPKSPKPRLRWQRLLTAESMNVSTVLYLREQSVWNWHLIRNWLKPSAKRTARLKGGQLITQANGNPVASRYRSHHAHGASLSRARTDNPTCERRNMADMAEINDDFLWKSNGYTTSKVRKC